MGTPTTAIGPGLGAFVAFFSLAVLLWLLMRNMNARMRRMAYAERDRVARADAEHLAREAEELAKEEAERGKTSGDTSTDSGPAAFGTTLPTPAEPTRQEPGTPPA